MAFLLLLFLGLLLEVDFMRNILLTCAENTDFNNLFKNLEKFPCMITFDNCGGSFNSIFSGNLQIICRKENYKEIQKILAKLV